MGPLSSDLNKMAWICHSVYPAVWHTHRTTIINSVGYCVIFFCLFGYFSCSLSLELHFPNALSLNSNGHLCCDPSTGSLCNHPPSTCSVDHFFPSSLHPSSSSPPLIRILIGSPALSCKHAQLPVLPSFA